MPTNADLLAASTDLLTVDQMWFRNAFLLGWVADHVDTDVWEQGLTQALKHCGH